MGTLLPSIGSLVEELMHLSPENLEKLAKFAAQLRQSDRTEDPEVKPASLPAIADRRSALENLDAQLRRSRGQKDAFAMSQSPDLARDNQLLYEFLESGSLDGFWYENAGDHEIRHVSPRLQQVLGYGVEEVPDPSTWLREHLDEADLSALQQEIERYCTDPSATGDRVLRYRHKNGSTVWMRSRLLWLPGNAGVSDRVLVTHTDVTAFTRAGERSRAIHEALPDMHIVLETTGFNVLSCNQNFQDISGFSNDEIIGRPFLDFLHSEGIFQFQAAFAALSKRGKCSNYELCFRSKDGSKLPTLVTSSLGYDCETDAPYIQSWCRDISHLQRLANFEFLLEALPDAILLIDFNGHIRASNAIAEEAFGYSRAELLQLDVGTLLPEKFRNAYRDLLRNLLERSTKRSSRTSRDLIGVRKNGQHFPAQIGLSRIQTSDGVLILVVIADRREQKQMEHLLLDHKERVRLALDSGAIGVWDFDATSGSSVGDARCKAAYGIPPDGDWSAEISLSGIHPDDRERVIQAVRAAYQSEGNGVYHTEFRTIGVSDGVLRYVQADGKVYFAKSGNKRQPTRFVGTLQDITSRKHAEEALVRANQDLEQFAYAAAHDLQEPLRNVATTMGLLKRSKQKELDEQSLSLIEESIESAKRMHSMVRDLLTFTRVTDLRGKLKEQADSGKALQQALSDLRNIIEETGAKIISDSLPPVSMHQTHLSQLFTNLLGNAIKYRKPGVRPRIEVAAVRKTPVWQFMIADNGIGFDPVHAEHIFGVFKRLHHQYEYPGTGIGLAICSRIVSLYGGRIWAEGQPDEGATFFFTVPLKKTEGHAGNEAL